MKTLPRTDDLLFQVERQIARRADALDRKLGINPGRALDHWRQAEQEVWSRAELTRGNTMLIPVE